MRQRLSLTSATSSSCPVDFLPVTDRAKSVAIIASGPSYREFDWRGLASWVHIIAVKGAIDGLGSRANSWMTVDANRKVRQLWMGDFCRHKGVKYYAAVPEDYGLPDARMRWHRPPAEKDFHYLKRIPGLGLSEDPSIIHTGNSAWGALGLAYHMQATKIALIGVDGTQDRYGVGQGQPRGDLSHLGALFLTAATQLNARGAEIKNAGALPTIPRENARSVMKWLNDA
jgi:hypothetical protein